MVVLWFLSSYPGAARRRHRAGDPVQHRRHARPRAARHVFAPIGFNWQISIALVPGLAAREVAVGALGTVYALSAAGDDVAEHAVADDRAGLVARHGLSLLAWYVFAPQCLSTLAVVQARDQLAGAIRCCMAAYLFALAYVAAFVTYRVALALGGGHA